MQTSIITGWLPVLVEVITLVAFALSIDWRSPRARKLLGAGAGGAAVLSALVTFFLRVTHLTPAGFSLWPSVWAAVTATAVWMAVMMWPVFSRRRHVLSISAVVLTLVCTLGSINASTQTFVTVSRLLHGQSQGVFHLVGIEQMQAQVARTGVLPKHGQLFITTIPPTVSGFQTRNAYVWLPPVWFKSPTPSLPAIVLLPGEPGSAADWSSSGDADVTANAFAAQHGGVAPILIMPDPNGVKTVDSECVNSQFGNAETYLAVDVPAYAHNQLNVSTAPGSLAIAGLSAGGTCSSILALNYPKLYRTFASYSGFATPQYMDDTEQQTIDILFGGSRQAFNQHSPLYLLEHPIPDYEGLGVWYASGTDDPATAAAARQLQPEAVKIGVATCIAIQPGGHDFAFWSQAFTDSLPWLSWRIGLTPKPASVAPATCDYP